MKTAKPYWEMTAAELHAATTEFDDPAYQPLAIQPTAEDLAQQRRAKAKGHPTRKRQPDKTISLTVERRLLARSDSYAKRLGISRAELFERGLLAILPATSAGRRNRVG